MRLLHTTLSLALTMSLSIPVLANANLQPLFGKLINTSNWNWQTFNNLPKTTKYAQGIKQDQNNANRFYLERQLTGYPNATITAYGNKATPNEVVFFSGGWGITSPASLFKLNDIVNPAELTKVNSNCNFGKIEDKYTGKKSNGQQFFGVNYIDSQTVYQWKRANAKPLYVVAMTGGGRMNTGTTTQGVNSTVIVVPQLANLNTAIAIHGWNKDKTGKKVSCRFG